jgi:hypothetical protein
VTEEDATSRARRIAELADLALDQLQATRLAVEDLLGEVRREAAPAAPVVRLEPVQDAGLDAARLVAIEMAVAGRTRQEVGVQIRSTYALSDVEALLDDVFGPEPDAGAAGS